MHDLCPSCGDVQECGVDEGRSVCLTHAVPSIFLALFEWWQATTSHTAHPCCLTLHRAFRPPSVPAAGFIVCPVTSVRRVCVCRWFEGVMMQPARRLPIAKIWRAGEETKGTTLRPHTRCICTDRVVARSLPFLFGFRNREIHIAVFHPSTYHSHRQSPRPRTVHLRQV